MRKNEKEEEGEKPQEPRCKNQRNQDTKSNHRKLIHKCDKIRSNNSQIKYTGQAEASKAWNARAVHESSQGLNVNWIYSKWLRCKK